ncbi:MAG: TRAP transporter substrate-binding protein [Oscillospiraceae bacterium]
MKKFSAILLCIIMALSLLAGCARGTVGGNSMNENTTSSTDTSGASDTSSTPVPTTTFEIRLGHCVADEHPYNQGALKFAQLVSEGTGGAVIVDVFGNSQLGAERDMVEGLQLGTVDMCLISTAPLSGFTSEFHAFDLPYLLTTPEQARGVCDSEIGQKMLDTLSAQGIKGLVYYENGFRNLTNSKHPIVEPGDLEGLKVRTMENEIMMYTFSVMDADPTPIAFNELYTALQQKTIDAQENPYALIYSTKLYEAQTYLSISEHFYAPAPLLMAQTLWDSLPAEYQDVIMQAAAESRDYERDLLDQWNSELIGKLEELGMEVNEIDRDAFVEATKPVYDKYVGDGEGQVPASLVESIASFQP